MNLIQKCTCKFRKMKYNCPNMRIQYAQASIEVEKEKILTIQSLKDHNLKILSGNMQYYKLKELQTEHEYNSEIGNLTTYCDLEPETCNQSLEKLYDQLQELEQEYRKCSEELDHIKRLKERILNRFINVQSNKYFFRLCCDTEGKWVAILVDMNDFLQNGHSKNVNLELIHSYESIPNSVMYLQYSLNGGLKIVDFFSNVKRKKHGSIMLQSLLELVPQLNELIEKYNNQQFEHFNSKGAVSQADFAKKYRSIYALPINHIWGSIFSNTKQYHESLYRFYDRNGFVIDEELLRYI